MALFLQHVLVERGDLTRVSEAYGTPHADIPLAISDRVRILMIPLAMGHVAVPAQLPKPDGKAAEQTRPIKVYVMPRQSNMLSFGRVGPKDGAGVLGQAEGENPHLVNAPAVGPHGWMSGMCM